MGRKNLQLLQVKQLIRSQLIDHTYIKWREGQKQYYTTLFGREKDQEKNKEEKRVSKSQYYHTILLRNNHKEKKEDLYITFCPLQLIVVVTVIKNDISCPQPGQHSQPIFQNTSLWECQSNLKVNHNKQQASKCTYSTLSNEQQYTSVGQV